MNWLKLSVAVLSALGLWQAPARAQDVAPPAEHGQLVVYGSAAPTREGDVDHREVIFF